MRCQDIENLSLKYELGELDFFQKKSFERHLRKCNKCNKKYASILLLGAMLFSAKKVYSPGIISMLLSTVLVKLSIVAVLVITGTVGGDRLYQTYFEEKIVNEIEVNKTIIEAKTEFRKSRTEDNKIKEKSKKDGMIIRAIEKEKEIEIKFNKNYERIERIEK